MAAACRSFLAVVLAGLFASGCAPLIREDAAKKYGPHAPIIDAYGATERVSAGRTWRIYLSAKDPDGDMDLVEFELDRPGYVTRDQHTGLDPESARSFVGYFYLNIPMVTALKGQELLGSDMALHCRIIDKAGHKSRKITLPFRVVLSQVPQPVPNDFADKEVRRLGPIMIRFELDHRWGKPFGKD